MLAQLESKTLSVGFTEYLQHWHERLAPLGLEQLAADASGPEHVAIFVVDLLNGFCYEGALQSDRVRDIVEPICALLTRAHAQGVHQFVLLQDSHQADSVEFMDFPVHCIRGSVEAETVADLLALPFAREFTTLTKRTISSAIDTGLDRWIRDHPEITHRIVVGDCTDLCTYQLAMHLKLTANARNVPLPVIVPSDCVATYDLPVDLARDLGVPAHPGGFFHQVFLYHMALNGIQVVDSIL